MHPTWLVPDWPAPPGVKAVFTTREGGSSLPPYESLNLGDHVGDDPSCVKQNRLTFADQLGATPVFLKQVHGQRVIQLGSGLVTGLGAASGAVARGDAALEADACCSTERGVACTVMVADCLPVLLTHLDAPVVAAAHAGWRGLVGVGDAPEHGAGRGVIDATLRQLLAHGAAGEQLAPDRTLAWLGPCIGPQAFEVGAEVKAAFEVWLSGAARFFNPAAKGKFLADLPGLARLQLRALGVTAVHGNDGSDAWCTVRNPALYFSHRRASQEASQSPNTGRMAASIWLA